MTPSDLLNQAQQGNPGAIAALLNRSFKPKGIRAMARHQADVLHILLEAQTLPSQATYIPLIRQGLQRLDVRSIQTVRIYGRTIGAQVFAWQSEIQLWPDEIRIDETRAETAGSKPSPDPVECQSDQESRADESATAVTGISLIETTGKIGTTESPEQTEAKVALLKPGWGFWCGWMMVSLVGSAIALLCLLYFESQLERRYGTEKVMFAVLTWASGLLPGLLVGLGQRAVLKAEVPWANRWVVQTALGGLMSTGLGFFFSGFYRTVPTIQHAFLFWLLMVVPIVACQWSLLREKISNALLWLVIPSIFSIGLGLILDRGLSNSLPLLDAVVLTRIAFFGVSGALMIWLLQTDSSRVHSTQGVEAIIYAQTVQGRSRFGVWFVLEWVGLTLLLWFLGRWIVELLPIDGVVDALGNGLTRLIVQLSRFLAWLNPFNPLDRLLGFVLTRGLVLLRSLTLDLPNVVKIVLWIGLISGAQWIVLRRRLNRAIAWVYAALLGSAVGGFLFLFIRAVGRVLTNWAIPNNAVFEPWQVPLSFGSLPSGWVVIWIWSACILAQGFVWRWRGYLMSKWLMANVGVVVLFCYDPVLRDTLNPSPLIPVMALVLPALAIAWMTAYPRRLSLHQQSTR